MKTIKNIHSTQGFVLIEVMIALALLAGGALSLSKLQSVLTQGDNSANEVAKATYLGQAQLESITTYTSLAGYNSIATGAGSATSQDVNYTLNWTVVPSTTYKQINMVVSWTNSKGQAKSVNLTSIVAQANPAQSNLAFQSLPSLPAIKGSTSTFNPNIPQGATDNGDGTCNHSQNGNTYTYNNHSGAVTAINGKSAKTICGTINVANGAGTDLSQVTVSTSSGACSQSGSGSCLNYSCTVPSGFSGNITVNGVNSGDSRFGASSQANYSGSGSSYNASYNNVTGNCTNEDISIQAAGNNRGYWNY